MPARQARKRGEHTLQNDYQTKHNLMTTKADTPENPICGNGILHRKPGNTAPCGTKHNALGLKMFLKEACEGAMWEGGLQKHAQGAIQNMAALTKNMHANEHLQGSANIHCLT